jgi:phospholipid-binding lipoprotein MlaA
VSAREVRLALALLLAGALAGCASAAPDGAGGELAPRHPVEAAAPPPPPPSAERYSIEVYDPFTGLNRRIYKFNAQFDEYVFLPVVDAYEAVTSEFVRDRATSFFLNVDEIATFANSVLQARPEKAVPTVFRFAINSTLGVFGLFDLATQLGIPREEEDLGQTLGVWGVRPGPYLVLPILGPSNLRDAAGLAGDAIGVTFAVPSSVQGDPAWIAARWGLQPIDIRYRTAFRYYSTGSPAEYEILRFLYTRMREIDVER